MGSASAADRASDLAPANPPGAATPVTVPPSDQPVYSPDDEVPGINWDAVSAIASVIATLLAAYAAYQSSTAAQQSEKAAAQSERSAQAMSMVQLWSDIEELSFLSSTELQNINAPAVAERVRANVNCLGKAAFYWQEHLVNREMLERQLGEAVIQLHEQIETIGPMAPLGRSGRELLEENDGIPPLVEALKKRFR